MNVKQSIPAIVRYDHEEESIKVDFGGETRKFPVGDNVPYAFFQAIRFATQQRLDIMLSSSIEHIDEDLPEIGWHHDESGLSFLCRKNYTTYHIYREVEGPDGSVSLIRSYVFGKEEDGSLLTGWHVPIATTSMNGADWPEDVVTGNYSENGKEAVAQFAANLNGRLLQLNKQIANVVFALNQLGGV